jgi:hypothetical protein
MIRLYTGSGSWEIQPLGPAVAPEQWVTLRAMVVQLLTARKRPGAKLLDKLPWELYEGTNFFGDEFQFLFARLPIAQYVEAAAYEHNDAAKEAAKALVGAFGELGTTLRFVAFMPDTEAAPEVVPAPRIEASAAATSRALADAERLLATGGPVSAVDRVHTALHGYLRELCARHGIALAGGESVTALWKRLRAEVPALSPGGPHAEHVTRLAGAVATILDALNPLRNNASLAHANAELLGEADALLAINAGRTLLHYLDAVLGH